MPTITTIEPQSNRNRVNIHLDGEFAFGLNRLVAARLTTGQELSTEMVARLQLDDVCEQAYQQAMLLLSFRARSELEIRRNLHKHKYPEAVIDHVLVRLRGDGLANDDQFARTWVENRGTFRPRSRLALTVELRRKGLDDETIQSALENVDDQALAYEAAMKRVGRYQELEWKGFRQKLSDFLARRGFPHFIVAQTVTRLWQEMHAESNPKDDEGMT